nr:alpha/beta fold hydrolase [Corynebacterium pseudogenitalium]
MALLSYVPRILPSPSTVNSQTTGRIVVALHGTGSSPFVFRRLSRALDTHGIGLIAPAYGRRATAGIDASSHEVAAFLDSLAAQQIDVVGHSYGALIGLRAVQLSSIAARCGTIVGLGASWRGTNGIARLFPPRLVRAVAGDAFVELEHFREEPVAPSNTGIVSIVSDADRIVPAWSSRWGDVIEVSGVSHAALPRRVDEIMAALGVPLSYHA